MSPGSVLLVAMNAGGEAAEQALKEINAALMARLKPFD